MQPRIASAVLGLAMLVAFALPASAQIGTRDRGRTGRTGATSSGTISDIVLGRDADRTTNGRSDRVPPGHLPPRGLCRVWIDGVPPGQQPPVASCVQAEQDRVRYGANARVIYGDRDSFRGRANGKFDKRHGNGRDVNDDDDDRRFGRGRATDAISAASINRGQGNGGKNRAPGGGD